MSGPRARVLVLTPDFPPATGGIQTLMHELVRHLDRVAAGVVTFASPGCEAFDARSSIDVRRIDQWRASHRLSVLRLNAAAVRAAVATRPDVILSGHIVLAPATLTLHRVLRRPVVQYVYANEFAARPGLTRRAVRGADAVIAVSRHTERMAHATGKDPREVHLVPPGVAPRASVRSERRSRPTILTVARLAVDYKGHDVMIRALALVRDRVPDVEWIVVGEGPLRQALQALAQREGITDSVRFLGEVSDAERDRWMDRAHVFALPSRLPASGTGGEGFGIVFLEAAVHEMPVVAGAVGGAMDAVAHEETGLLVDPEDPVAVADALSELLLDPARARALGLAGARRTSQFSWARVATAVEDVLLRTAGRR